MEVAVVFIYLFVVWRLPMIFSIIGTLVHAGEEIRGHLPEYFSELSNRPFTVTINRSLAYLLFGPALAASLIIASCIGYHDLSREPLQGSVQSIFLALLCGARLGDATLSHALLWFYKAPNPGISSSAMYFLEGAWIMLYIHWGGLEVAAAAATASSFALINPRVGLVGLKLTDDNH